MSCYSPLKGFRDLETGGIVFRRSSRAGSAMEVACGQCLGCRLDYSRVWAMRIVHESTLHELDNGSCFVTLTYRSHEQCDERQLATGRFIPGDWSLDKRHFQLFMKRLRKHFAGTTIRYFQVGEYGRFCEHGFDVEDGVCVCNVGRPHHHAILFNCAFDDRKLLRNAGEYSLYSSETLDKLWRYGFCSIGEVNMVTAGYVARYCLKKVNGVNSEEYYQGKVPEYATMSRRPGIGRDWFHRYKDDCFPSDEVPVPGHGVVNKVPRYYQNLMEEEDPDVVAGVKELRQAFRDAHSDEFSSDRLMAKYNVKRAAIRSLKREL